MENKVGYAIKKYQLKNTKYINTKYKIMSILLSNLLNYFYFNTPVPTGQSSL